MRARAAAGSPRPDRARSVRNADSHYPYRHDSYFYYLSGFPDPKRWSRSWRGADEGDSKQILFCRDKNPEREIWDGFRYGPDAAREIFGFDEALSDRRAARRSCRTRRRSPARCSRRSGLSGAGTGRSRDLLNEVRSRVRTGVAAPEDVVDVRARARRDAPVKDAHELKLMRRAAAISGGAHRRAMERTRAGWYEYQVEAELMHEFLR